VGVQVAWVTESKDLWTSVSYMFAIGGVAVAEEDYAERVLACIDMMWACEG
jgi:hypothetical protein